MASYSRHLCFPELSALFQTPAYHPCFSQCLLCKVGAIRKNGKYACYSTRGHLCHATGISPNGQQYKSTQIWSTRCHGFKLEEFAGRLQLYRVWSMQQRLSGQSNRQNAISSQNNDGHKRSFRGGRPIYRQAWHMA